MCKCSNVLSWPILIGRGLILKKLSNKQYLQNFSVKQKFIAIYFKIRDFKRFYAVVSLQWLNLVYYLYQYSYITIVVTIALRIHLFSFRTQKLSSAAPKVLDGQPSGRIGCCHIPQKARLILAVLFSCIIFKSPPISRLLTVLFWKWTVLFVKNKEKMTILQLTFIIVCFKHKKLYVRL